MMKVFLSIFEAVLGLDQIVGVELAVPVSGHDGAVLELDDRYDLLQVLVQPADLLQVLICQVELGQLQILQQLGFNHTLKSETDTQTNSIVQGL